MTTEPRTVQPSLRRTGSLAWLLVSPFVWAIPFAVFFNLLYGARLAEFGSFYLVSLVFSVTIRGAVFLVERFALPRLRLETPVGRYPWMREGLLFTLASMLGSFVAAAIVDRFLFRGFLGGGSGLLRTGLYSSVFTILVGAIIYAKVFYRSSVQRAVALERVRGELARAELRALRAQVNPHFLFNTLNTIAALITEKPAEAEDIVTRLADVFRYALTSADREHSRLADEFEFLNAYLAIERARLGDRLRLEVVVEPGCEDVPVPSLLFQPLVENAVRYAVAPRAEGGSVRVHARREAGSLVVEVADDGPGFQPGARPSGHGVGLESVRERLRLAGAGHALDITSSPQDGTRIRVTLPLIAGGAPNPLPSRKEIARCEPEA